MVSTAGSQPQDEAHEGRAGSNLAGRYTILGRLGAGGQGEVFLAHDTRLDRAVAIKRISTRVDGDASEIRDEARLQGQLVHPNIVAVHDVFQHDGLVHLVSEFVDGSTLGESIARGAVPLVRALEILAAVARALGYAHAKGVVHGDVTAHNVLLGPDGTPKLGDFGLARLAGTDRPSGFASRHATAPEVIDGGAPNAAADMFALGVLAYETLTGVAPFAAPTESALDHAIRQASHRPVREWIPTIPDEVARLVDRLLEKTPLLRPQSADTVADELLAAARARASVTSGDPLDAGQPVRATFACFCIAADPTASPRDSRALVSTLGVIASCAAELGGEIVYGAGAECLVAVGLSNPTDGDCETAARIASAVLKTIADGDRGTSRVRVALDVGDAWCDRRAPYPVVIGAPIDHARALARGLAWGVLGASSAARSRLASRFQLVPRLSSSPATTHDRSGADSRQGASPYYEVVASSGAGEGAGAATLPHVGRDETLAAVAEHLTASGGEPRLALVVGEPGIGKSRLLRELVLSTSARLETIACVARPETRFTPFFPFRGALRRLLGIEELVEDRPACARAIADATRRWAAPADAVALAIAADVAAEEDLARARTLFQRQRQDAVATEVARYLRQVLTAAPSPSVLVLEDLHWYDRSSHAVIEALLDQPPTGLRVVAASRGVDERFVTHPGSRRFELARLPREAAATLLGAIVDERSASPRVLEDVLVAADGLPLLLEELARGIDGRTDGGISGIPLSLGDRVAAQLDELAEPARRALELAALLGTAVRPLREGPRPAWVGPERAYLGALQTRGLIRRDAADPENFHFSHPLVRDEILRRIPAATRVGLERILVDQLDAARRAGAASPSPELAVHCEGAGLVERAIDEWNAAAREATDRGSHDAAIAHYEQALGLLRDVVDGDRRASLEVVTRDGLGIALSRRYGWASAPVSENSASLAAARSTNVAEPAVEISLWIAWMMAYAGGRMADTIAGLGALEHQARLAGPRTLWAYLTHVARGITFLHLGRLPQAQVALREAREIRPELRDALLAFPMPEPMVMPETYGAWTYLLVGDRQAAYELQHRAEQDRAFESRHHVVAGSMGMPFFQAARDEASTIARARRVLDDGSELALPHRATAAAVLAGVDLRRPNADVSIAGCVSTIWTSLAPYRHSPDAPPDRPRMRAGYVVSLVDAADACTTLAASLDRGSPRFTEAMTAAASFVDAALFDVVECDPGVHAYYASEAFRAAAVHARLLGDRDLAEARLEEARRRATQLDSGERGGAWLLLDRIAEVGGN